MQDQSIDTTRRTVAITLPILFVVLLLLLRAPVAALGITALAAGTAYSGLGLTALSGKVMDVDAISVLLGTMTGLVLGAGYGLIFFRRWRGAYRESGTAHDAAYAASTTVKSTGRALLIAGTAMILANLVTDALGPTEVLSSLFIDATQSLGVLPLDVRDVQPDYLVAATYKWLLGPYGMGFLYVAPHRQSGRPIEEHWSTRSGSEDFARLVDYRDEYQPGARRFDVGEKVNIHLVPMAITALNQSLAWGTANIQASLRAMTDLAGRVD